MSKTNKSLGFETRAIHSGQQPDPTTGAIMTPIYASSTYVQKSPGVHQGYEYSRSHNPTRKALEDCISSLENGSAGYAFASGMSATATVLELLDSGDHVIAMDDLYGGTYRLFENVRKRSAGLEFTFADLSDLDSLEASLQENTKMIWVESPTNPLLKLVDLEAVSRFAKKHNLIAVCDNTFCSPYIQKPLNFGSTHPAQALARGNYSLGHRCHWSSSISNHQRCLYLPLTSIRTSAMEGCPTGLARCGQQLKSYYYRFVVCLSSHTQHLNLNLHGLYSHAECYSN